MNKDFNKQIDNISQINPGLGAALKDNLTAMQMAEDIMKVCLSGFTELSREKYGKETNAHVEKILLEITEISNNSPI